MFSAGDTLVKLLMHSSDDVTCVALEALLAIFTNGNLEQKKVCLLPSMCLLLVFLWHHLFLLDRIHIVRSVLFGIIYQP